MKRRLINVFESFDLNDGMCYKLTIMIVTNKYEKTHKEKTIGKLYKSRAEATRNALKYGKVRQWYMI